MFISVPWMERQLVNDLMLSRLAIVLWISVSIFITMGSIYFCYYNQKRRKIMKINNIEVNIGTYSRYLIYGYCVGSWDIKCFV